MCILDEFTKEDLSRIIAENSSLRGYVQGYLAEDVLRDIVLELPYVTSVVKIPDQDDAKGDLLVTYKDTSITIESKSLAADSLKVLEDGTWEAKAKVDQGKPRTQIFSDGSSTKTYLVFRGQFDILSVCCYMVNNRWEFLFMKEANVPSPVRGSYTQHQKDNLLRNGFRINKRYTPGLTDDLPTLLEQVYVSKSQIQSRP